MELTVLCSEIIDSDFALSLNQTMGGVKKFREKSGTRFTDMIRYIVNFLCQFIQT